MLARKPQISCGDKSYKDRQQNTYIRHFKHSFSLSLINYYYFSSQKAHEAKSKNKRVTEAWALRFVSPGIWNIRGASCKIPKINHASEINANKNVTRAILFLKLIKPFS